jgi:tetratricopeptide (TPR) repeat protein
MTTTTLHPASHREKDSSTRPATQAGSTRRLDPRGCPIGTASQAAIDHVETATWRLASYFGDPLADLDAAIAEDPAWILPYLMKANGLLTMAEYRFNEMARETVAQGIAENSGRGMQPREQAHLAATQACLAGQWRAACDLWDRILVDYPQDLAALLPAHLFDFYRGDSLNLRKRIARVLPDWSQSAPLYSFVLGQYAFGLEECNLYPQAREAGQQALALEPRDAWAIHAVTHVNEMQGRFEEGAQWLSSREQDWAPDNGFAFHNWWHLALFHLERLDTQAALRILDDHVAPGAEMALQHVDVAALLWRLSLMDVDVGDRWSRLAPSWPLASPAAGFYSFNDLHAVLTHVGAGRIDLAQQVLDVVAAGSGAATTCATVAADTGLPLIRSVIATASGRHDEAVEALLAVRDTAFRFGGSHAQRDLVEQTLLAAAIRAGRRGLARHLLNERVMAKPHSPLTAFWAQRIG